MICADNAATTKMSKAAICAMLPYMDEFYGNPSSLYTFGQKAKEALEDARSRIAACLGAQAREYPIGEILRLTEGDLAPVACLRNGAEQCTRTAKCRTLHLWAKLDCIINEYLDGVTLDDLMKA